LPKLVNIIEHIVKRNAERFPTFFAAGMLKSSARKSRCDRLQDKKARVSKKGYEKSGIGDGIVCCAIAFHGHNRLN
jgi:hypothetical protein